MKLKHTILIAVLIGFKTVIFAQNMGVTDANTIIPKSLLHLHKNASTGQILQLTNNTSGNDATTKGFVIDLSTDFNILFKNQYQNTNAGLGFWTYTNGGSLTEKMTLTNDGKLGIGITPPLEQLHITGNFRLPTTSSSAEGCFYAGANIFIHNYGINGTFLGFNAGNLSYTGNGNNTGIGANSLTALTSGEANTAIGYMSGNSITSGSSNIFLGSYAGKFETGSNTLFIDNQSRTNEATAQKTSLIYGKFDASTANQYLRINGKLQLLEIGSSPEYHTILQSADLSSNITLTLPNSLGSNNQVLTTNGSGVLSWTDKASGSSGWLLTGNSGLDPATNFLGTSDAVDLILKTNNTSRAKITSAGVTTIGDGTNQTKIESDGTIVLQGNATVWDDLLVATTSTKLGGTKDPTFGVFKTNGSGSQGVFTYWFSNSQEEELYFMIQLPHGWKEGTDIKPHVHWSSSTAIGSNRVTWGLEYTWANIGDAYGNSTITTAYEPIASYSPYAAYEHIITPLGTLSGTGKTMSSILVCRLFRKFDDTNDTFTGNAGILYIDFHYEKDMLGSRDEFTK